MAPTADTADAEAVPYSVEFAGNAGKDLVELARASSVLVSLKDSPPASLAGLVRRAESDRERLRTVLRSRGFYDSEVHVDVAAATEDHGTEPTQVTVRLEEGVVYLLADYRITWVGDHAPPPQNDMPALEDLGLHVGAYAAAAPIVTAQERLVRHLRENARPFAEVADRTVLVDHGETTATVVLKVDPGPPARFGPVQVEGLSGVEPSYLLRRVPWDQGADYDAGQVDAFRDILLDSGLFKSVAVRHADQPAADGTLPLTVSVVEAEHRTVGAGVRYSTGEGPGLKLFWEHRNLLGEAERLRAELEMTTIHQGLEFSARKPGFRDLDQDLVGNLSANRVRSEAYTEEGLGVRAGVERRYPPHWTASALTSVEVSNLTDTLGTTTSRLFGLPLAARRDTTRSRLDPRQGTRLGLSLTPYTGKATKPLNFLVSEVSASAYTPLDADKRFVIASRLRAGTILGEGRQSIPANKRFYSGGGGSVRGFAFQKIGPLDAEGDPLGGRSLIEVGSELRMRLTDTIGIVPFVEGGEIYESSSPHLDDNLRWAAGLGFRYYTGIGPLRVDIAVPLNRRRGIDDDYQFYISLGQAF